MKIHRNENARRGDRDACRSVPIPYPVPGPRGPEGPRGPQGPSGSAPTPTYAFAENALESIVVTAAGVLVPLARHFVLSAGVSVSVDATVFTVLVPGVYRLAYAVNTEAPSLVGTRLLLNGRPVEAAALSFPTAVNQHAAEALLHLTAGDALSLQLYGVDQRVTFLSGAGASLSIIKIN